MAKQKFINEFSIYFKSIIIKVNKSFKNLKHYLPYLFPRTAEERPPKTAPIPKILAKLTIANKIYLKDIQFMCFMCKT